MYGAREVVEERQSTSGPAAKCSYTCGNGAVHTWYSHSGTGTMLFAAAALGFDSCGCDVNKLVT